MDAVPLVCVRLLGVGDLGGVAARRATGDRARGGVAVARGVPHVAGPRGRHGADPNPLGRRTAAHRRPGRDVVGDRRRALPARAGRPLGAGPGDGQRLRPHRDHHVGVQEHAAAGRVGLPADRLTGDPRGLLRAGRVAAPGARRRGRRALPGRPRRGRRVLASPRADRVAVHGLPVRRTGHPDVSHRRPGLLGSRRATALLRPRRRAGQSARLPHRTRRDPGRAVRARRRRAGRRGRPRGPARRQAPGGLRHRVGGPGRGARRGGRAAARLHGAGRGGGARRAAGHGQRQARRPRPAGARLPGRRQLPRPQHRGRGDPGRHLRPGPGRRTRRRRRLVLRPRWRLAVHHAPGHRDQRRAAQRPSGARGVRGAHRRAAGTARRGERGRPGAAGRR
ncbi:hypothetical protein MYCO108962_23535 [Mycobacterium colombiense]